MTRPSTVPLYLGRSIRFHRQQAGLGLDRMADRVGISKNALWKIEKGQSNPSFLNVCSIAIVLGVSLDTLTAWTPEPKGGPE